MTNPTPKELAAWQDEYDRLLLRSVHISIPLAILTYCGGTSIPTYLQGQLTQEMALLVWMPAVVMLLAYGLYRLRAVPLMVPAYSVPVSLFLCSALQPVVNIDEGSTSIIVLSNIPNFVAISLVLFWHQRHAIVMFVMAVVFNAITFPFRNFPDSDYYNFFYLVIPIGLASIALMWYRYSTTRRNFLVTEALNRSNEELAESNRIVQKAREELEDKNQAITDSIRYAKRIQNAILPDMEMLSHYLPHSAVLYRPKDIVSGDFYWFAQAGDTSVLAVVDCTGHGVPGAFMSLIGYNGLDRLVNDLNITEPAELLLRLDRMVVNMLEQEGHGHQLRDGMDIALCVHHQGTSTVSFAGAHRPLFVVRQGELEEIKGSRFPIGDSQITNKVFEGQQLTVAPGDVLWLTSDGYADQFGGPDGTKYYKKRFKNLLASVHGLPVAEQMAKVEQALDEWQGDHKQIDDITVVAFSIG